MVRIRHGIRVGIVSYSSNCSVVTSASETETSIASATDHRPQLDGASNEKDDHQSLPLLGAA